MGLSTLAALLLVVGACAAQGNDAAAPDSQGGAARYDRSSSSSRNGYYHQKPSQFPTPTAFKTRSVSPTAPLTRSATYTASTTFFPPPPPIRVSPTSTPPPSASVTPVPTATRTPRPSRTGSATESPTGAVTRTATQTGTLTNSESPSFLPPPPPVEVSAPSTPLPSAPSTPAPCVQRPNVLLTWYQQPSCALPPGDFRSFVSVPEGLCQANPTGQGAGFGGYLVQCDADRRGGVFQSCTTNTCGACTAAVRFASGQCVTLLPAAPATGSASVVISCDPAANPPERVLPQPGDFAVTWHEAAGCASGGCGQHTSVVIGAQGICHFAPPSGGYRVTCAPDGRSGTYAVCQDALCASCAAVVPFSNDACLPNGDAAVTGSASVNFRCAPPAAAAPPALLPPPAVVAPPPQPSPPPNQRYGDNRWGY